VPAIDDQAFRVLRADIEARGLQVPLEATPTGVVLDGRARLAGSA
jgi:ParB-like chromosome segregation protein Spo0J